MRNIYSPWLKCAAFLLCIASFAAAVTGMYIFVHDYEDVYMFESSFDESRWVEEKLRCAAYEIYSALKETEDEFDGEYFADYEYIVKGSDGETILESEGADINSLRQIRDFSDKKIYVGLTEEAERELYAKWSRGQASFKTMAPLCGGLLILAAVCFIYLLAVCGRRAGDSSVHLTAFDAVPAEISLCAIFAAMIAGICAAGGILRLTTDGSWALAQLCAPAAALTLSAAIVALSQSVVRQFKAKAVVKNSLVRKICRLIVRLWRFAVRILRKMWDFAKKSLKKCERSLFSAEEGAPTWKIMTIFAVYNAAMIIAVLLRSPIAVIVIIASACFFIKRRGGDFMEIKSAVCGMKDGNLSVRADVSEGVFASFAADINSIGEGLEASLEEKVKAERMKSELITNVSHDLKTPLTSIINYAKLLSDMELLPEEANDYVRIIAKKSGQLKNLTSDLFDYSKVQSGNADIKRERIDLALLVRQALAENGEAIEKSGLQFAVDIPEKAPAEGDGKKLSRVLENLIGNALKYALEGTRVYVTVKECEIEIKNIANYEMTFDEDEITERFVRGDAARTSEGSGLGLAIAKSYIEAMGGEFFVKRDGDLFKAIVKLQK